MTVERIKYSHLTWTDRTMIERLYNRGKCKKEIAASVGCSLRTIYREISRGLYQHLNSDLTASTRYAAEIAHRKYEETLLAKGPPLKISNDHALAAYIESKIINEKHSPYAALMQIHREKKQFKVSVSVSTVYAYIDKGVFLNLTNEHLPEKAKRNRQYKRVRKRASRPPAGASIEHRPKHIEGRDEIGHWEMDTVIGRRSGRNQTLLVLSERATRLEIVIPIKSRKSACVINALNKLERKYKKDFKRKFKTITVDNGSEFADCINMEKSILTKGSRTKLFYCHPYSSWERGTNENINRMIRRFIPKGTSMADIKPSEIKRIEHWINNYPRRILHGNAAIDYWT